MLSYLINNSAFSQVNYFDFKDRYDLSCGLPDSTHILANQHLVDSLYGLIINIGEKEFLYDHGWVYFMRYQEWRDIQDLKVSVSSFEKSWAQFQDLSALWNLGSIYKELGDCRKALDFTELFVNEAKGKKEIDYQQLYFRFKNCRNKE